MSSAHPIISMKRLSRRLLHWLLITCATLPALSAELHAQSATSAPDPTASRPKIGLALSGGGARGAAHIGVLKVLEELRVPVHCVAGTSMGSIVGGGFAAGATPNEMQRLMTETDWNDVFVDRPPRGEIAIRRKLDDYKNLFAPEFGLRDGSLLLPKGLVAGVSIESLIRKLTEPAAAVGDFGRLPVPFRAVATDIESGEAIILSRGSLTQALRASMAVPGAISPVEIDGRLLVDGGIANNLPIDQVREMCADVIIAVNIQTPPLTRAEITSALTIVVQLINFLGKDNVDRQLKSLGPRDVLIQPDLGDISAGSFDRGREAIKIGEAAARAMADSLRRYSVSENEYASLRKTQLAQKHNLVKIDEIRFEGVERTRSEVLAALIESKPGEELSEDKIAADLRRIYGRGDFDAVDYRIEQGPGARALVIRVHEKEIGPNYLRFGLGLASDFQGDANFNALVSYRRTWVNRLGGEFVAEAQVGQNNYLFTEFYQPFEARGRLFGAAYGQVGQYTRGVFVNDDRIAEYQARENRLGLDVGATLGTWGEVRIGPLYRDVRAEVDTGPPVLPEINANASGVRMRVVGDRVDAPWFPRSGHRAVLTAFSTTSALGADESYQRYEGVFTAAASFGAHTLSATIWGGTDAGSNVPPYDPFILGGPFRLSGYRIGQFSGQSMAFANVRYYHQIHQLPSLIGSGIYAGASIEGGRVNDLYDGRSSTGNLWSASLYIGAETFLGPLFLGAATGGGKNRTIYLLLGAP